MTRNPEHVTANLQSAMALMTSVYDDESSTAYAEETLMRLIRVEGNLGATIANLTGLTLGLQSLCTLLLELRRRERGISPLATIQGLALGGGGQPGT